MAKDPAIKYTDEELKDLEDKIKAVYSEAESDIQKKMDDFNEKFQKKDLAYQKQLKDGLITQEEYDNWKKGQVFTGKQWAAKKNEISATLHNSNKIATAMINGSTLSVFAENSNYTAYSLEHGAGANFGFDLYNVESVNKLIKEDPQLLPKWKVDQKKDYVWNQKNINMALTQGIIQGESLKDISKRVSSGLAGKNQNLMNTFAKTGMTQAQNSGRLERLEKAKKLGLNVKKEWIATLDNRTRFDHQQLDGQVADTDGYFKVGGLKIRYPGDPEAHPSLVYNCRCALGNHLVDYPSTYQRYDNVLGQPIDGMSYNEWKNLKVAESEVEGIASLFSKMRMSPLYYEMRDLDSKLANQFYKELGKYGKPSDVWTKYLSGQLDDSSTTIIDDILTNYATKKGMSVPGAVTPSATNFRITYKDKKMSQMYNDLKAYDTKLANQFYKELGAMGKPSDVWTQYLNGTLDPADAARIEKYLNQFSSSKIPGTIAPTVAPKPVVPITSATPKPITPKPVTPAVTPTSTTSTVDEKWLRRNLKVDKLKDVTNDPNKVMDEMIKQLNKTSDEYKKSFVGVYKKTKFDYLEKDSAYYENWSKRVNINLDIRMRDCANYENPLHVFFHEMGHNIDYNARKGTFRFTQSPELKEAFKKDIDVLNKLMSDPAELKALNDIMRDNESRGIQDIFSSFKTLNSKGPFKNKINSNYTQVRFRFCHDDEYWNREKDPTIDARSELFAHMSAAQCSDKQREYMEKYFPNSFKEFDNALKISKFNK